MASSKTYQSIPILFLSTLIISLSPTPSHSADPDPLQDFCIADLSREQSINGFPCKLASKVTKYDFFFHGLQKEGNTRNPLASNVTAGNVLTFPGLNTLGLSMNRVDMDIGGINPPHIHPRATETGFVVTGTVLVGLITTGNKLYTETLIKGDMFVAPRGLVHFQLNVGSTKALIVTAFNSQLPGVVVVSQNLFGSDPPVQVDVLTKAFRVNNSVIDQIRSKFDAKKK